MYLPVYLHALNVRTIITIQRAATEGCNSYS
nr:MAG TPA: hypothetical protein [Caudoviricetes sp.]